jgi:hypothetical protein
MVRAARQRLDERAAERADDSVLNERQKKVATARLTQSGDSFSAAVKDLGKDSALFRYVPLPPSIEDPAKVPFMQSVLPDRRGLFPTVYLDGSITPAPSTDPE